MFGYQDTEKKQSDETVVTYYLPAGSYVSTFTNEFVEITNEIVLGHTLPKLALANTNKAVSAVDGQSFFYKRNDVKQKSANANKNVNASDFYNPAENSVVRSFETAMGMGLAAVVTSLNFTWMDALWGVGEDGSGNRAPRSCKVQMNFEPIHDIAPGLDHEGFNRAPIYPVGNLVNGIIEGGEQEPYGPGTQRRSDAAATNSADKLIYEQAIKPNTFNKLF